MAAASGERNRARVRDVSPSRLRRCGARFAQRNALARLPESLIVVPQLIERRAEVEAHARAELGLERLIDADRLFQVSDRTRRLAPP
eukprot:79709-Prymnesium_polylepis.1